MSDRVLINCATYGDTLVEWPAGAYLASYDPEANDGQGHASWTDEPGNGDGVQQHRGGHECYRTVPANRPIARTVSRTGRLRCSVSRWSLSQPMAAWPRRRGKPWRRF